MCYAKILSMVYGSLWKAAIPLLRNHKRLKDGFEERLAPPDWPCANMEERFPSGPRIWFQAASGGEATLLAPVITHLYQEITSHSSAPLPVFICTSCTRQGIEVIQKSIPKLPFELHSRIVVAYFPLDSPAIMRRAISQLRPDMVVLLETELWPGLIHELVSASIPYCIANARMTGKTFKAYKKARAFFGSHQPREIIATTAENAARFAEIFSMPVSQAPNVKFDIIQQQLHDIAADIPAAKVNELVSWLDARDNITPAKTPCLPPVISLASVREEEEPLLFPVIGKICAHTVHALPCLCCIAPRHLHRVDVWAAFLRQAGIRFVLKSQLSGKTLPGTQCILWDTFGELNTLYALSDVAFIGGSLAPLGGQNFLEPLAQGTATVIGPYWTNFAWVSHDFFQPGMLQEEADAQHVLQALLSAADNLLAPPAEQWADTRQTARRHIRQTLAATVAGHTGGSLAIARNLGAHLGYLKP